MRLIDADELLNELDRLDLDYGATGGVAECIAIIEQAQTIEPSKSRPYGDCAKCIHKYGTLGCCSTVNNEWVYDCDNGMAQYEKPKPSRAVTLSAEPTTSGYIADDKEVPPYTTTCACQEENDHSGEATEMVDLISRADAICEVLVNDGIDNIVDRINALPSVERPKGEWIIRDNMPKLDNTYSIECSECGQLMFGHYNADNPNYCPHCGADMQLDK